MCPRVSGKSLMPHKVQVSISQEKGKRPSLRSPPVDLDGTRQKPHRRRRGITLQHDATASAAAAAVPLASPPQPRRALTSQTHPHAATQILKKNPHILRNFKTITSVKKIKVWLYLREKKNITGLKTREKILECQEKIALNSNTPNSQRHQD